MEFRRYRSHSEHSFPVAHPDHAALRLACDAHDYPLGNLHAQATDAASPSLRC